MFKSLSFLFLARRAARLGSAQLPFLLHSFPADQNHVVSCAPPTPLPRLKAARGSQSGALSSPSPSSSFAAAATHFWPPLQPQPPTQKECSINPSPSEILLSALGASVNQAPRSSRSQASSCQLRLEMVSLTFRLRSCERVQRREWARERPCGQQQQPVDISGRLFASCLSVCLSVESVTRNLR